MAHNTSKCTDNTQDLDKYELDLRFRPRHRHKIQEAKNCQIFKLWDSQTQDKFGFIPLQVHYKLYTNI